MSMDQKIQYEDKVEEIILEAYNTRRDNACLYPSPLLWIGLIFSFGILWFWLIISFYINNNALRSFAGILAIGPVILTFIFLLFYFRYGKKLFTLTSEGLHITWTIFIPFKKYSIPLDEISCFRMTIESSKSHGDSHLLVANTSDLILPMLESKNYDLLNNVEKKLNNVLETLKDKDKSNCLNKQVLILQESKYVDKNGWLCQTWNITDKSMELAENDTYVYSRHGIFDFYTFVIILLCNCFIASSGVRFAEDFFTFSFTPAIIIFLFSVLMAGGFSFIMFLTLASFFYRKDCFFKDNCIICQVTFFLFKRIREIPVDRIKMIVLDSESGFNLSSILLGNQMILPLFHQLTTWRLKIQDHNNKTIMIINTSNRSETKKLADDLKNLYGVMVIQEVL
ncbi:MAG: hypothetical protein LBU34_06350 [Planctomycetaceae bacterium]|jgi:hypothetical protein|nr:hypothetical protein [Planctomycetaceae bacterium]